MTGLGFMFNGRYVNSLAELTQEEREDGIFSALMDIEAEKADSALAKWYKFARKNPDLAERMRADIAYWERIRELRNEGKMTSAVDLRKKANSLSDILDPVELWKQIMEHRDSFDI